MKWFNFRGSADDEMSYGAAARNVVNTRADSARWSPQDATWQRNAAHEQVAALAADAGLSADEAAALAAEVNAAFDAVAAEYTDCR
jgi:hypothetical protein